MDSLRAYTVQESGSLIVWCPQCAMHHKVSRGGLKKSERNFGFRLFPCGAAGFLLNNGMADAQQIAEVENAARGALIRSKAAHQTAHSR
jgi:hypothetical protein